MAAERCTRAAKKKSAFSIPSVEEIKEASKIGVGSKRSLFQSKPPAPTSKPVPDTTLPAKDVPPYSEPPPAKRDIPCGAELSVGVGVASSTSTDIAPSTSTGRPYAIIINPLQKSNPLMKHIRNVSWEVGDIVPDFELGRTSCALYLSIRYHSLYPEYIHERLKALGKSYALRILLVHVDTNENRKVLKELAKMALLADLTLMLAWSYEEAARYLETYKAYENKPPDLLKERVDSDFSSRVTECLTTVKKVNKTDAGTLLNTFKTMDKLIRASKEELTLCPGLGPQKAQRLYALFHEPFLRQDKPLS